MTGEKILIVEDESIVALNIQMRLEDARYCVAGVADSGQAALSLIAETDPDLILLDIQLKGNQNGVKVAQMIREQFGIPVVYLTAYADTTIFQQAQQTEPYGYILKPFNPTNLYSTIEIALSKHRSHTHLQKLNHELEQCVQERNQALELVNQHLKVERTKRKRTETSNLQALEKEREFSELRSRFITTASHEFRTPLSIVMTSAELLERMGKGCPEERRISYLHKIREAVRSMTRILTDLLTIGQAKADQLEFNPTQIEVKSFCAAILSDLQLSATSSPSVQFDVIGDRTTVFWDADLITLIVTNLLSNALKYSPNRTPIELTVQCPASSDDQTVIICLQDYGIGIPPEDLPRLFESFHRAKNVDTIAGVGLGLAIVQQCVKRHHGDITIHSEIKRGTIVTVTLPIDARL
jgi:signal transduction histidine kinase